MGGVRGMHIVYPVRLYVFTPSLHTDTCPNINKPYQQYVLINTGRKRHPKVLKLDTSNYRISYLSSYNKKGTEKI